jgi:hypothetical protein
VEQCNEAGAGFALQQAGATTWWVGSGAAVEPGAGAAANWRIIGGLVYAKLTSSAPRDFTQSTFLGPAMPTTYRLSALASCTHTCGGGSV